MSRNLTKARAEFLRDAVTYPENVWVSYSACYVELTPHVRRFIILPTMNKMMDLGWLDAMPAANGRGDERDINGHVRIYVTEKGAAMVGLRPDPNLLRDVQARLAMREAMRVQQENLARNLRLAKDSNERMLEASRTMLAALRAVLDGPSLLGVTRQQVQEAVDLAEGNMKDETHG